MPLLLSLALIVSIVPSFIVEAATAPWSKGSTYTQGDVVSWNGAEWQANWWTLGEEPGTTGEWGVWKKASNTPVDPGPVKPDPKPDPKPEVPVEPGPVNPKPETPVNPSGTWKATAVYTGGQRVTWGGGQWEAKWWTQGDEPGKGGNWGVWKQVDGKPVEPEVPGPVEPEIPNPKPENDPPHISTPSVTTIYVGDHFDPLADADAKDAEDGNLKHKLVVTGKVNTAKAGTYQLTYSVTDSAGATTTETIFITVKAKPVTPVEPGQPSGDLAKRLLIGYWHTWGGDASGGVPFVKLRDVDPNWDIINISFAEPIRPGSTDGKMHLDITGLTAAYTKDDFKADIKYLQSQGKKVVLAIGGYVGYFTLPTDAAVNQFTSDIKGMVDEYGFDGIDIDFEQTSVELQYGVDADYKNPQSAKVTNAIKAIKNIVHSYGPDFILSWAPETFYAQLGQQFYAGTNSGVDRRAGVYLPMIHALREETTFVHVQLYNSMPIQGLDGKLYSMGNTDAVVAMTKMMLEGFNLGNDPNNFFEPLRPDQVTIGVPASQGAAGSGQISNAALQKAFDILDAQHPGLRGIMTWSINWDAFQNKNEFAKSNGNFLRNKQ